MLGSGLCMLLDGGLACESWGWELRLVSKCSGMMEVDASDTGDGSVLERRVSGELPRFASSSAVPSRIC